MLVRCAEGAVSELDGHVEPVAEGAAVGVWPLRGQRCLADDQTLYDRARGPGLLRLRVGVRVGVRVRVRAMPGS